MINTTIGKSNNLEFREKDLLNAIKRTSNKEYNKYKYKLNYENKKTKFKMKEDKNQYKKSYLVKSNFFNKNF